MPGTRIFLVGGEQRGFRHYNILMEAQVGLSLNSEESAASLFSPCLSCYYFLFVCFLFLSGQS